MKKTILSFGILFLLFSCTREKDIQENPFSDGTVTEFSASLSGTKVCLGEKEGDSYPSLWQSGDRISVNGCQSNALTDGDGYSGTNYAMFTIEGVISAPFYSAYPSSAVSNYSPGSATITIPAQQAYIPGQYDPAAYVLLGSGSSPSLSFQPQMALFKITPAAPAEGSLKISSIKLETLGDEKMSGAFATDFTSLSGGEGSYVAVSAPEGGLDFGTPVILAIPAQTYASGLRFVISADDGSSMSFSRTSSFTASPGTIYPLETSPYVPSSVTINGHWRVNSSAISIGWNCSNPDNRTKKPWRIHVYSNSECTAEVETYDLPASEAWVLGKNNRFVVAGLAQGTTYWFKVEDIAAGVMSEAVSESTSAFTVAPMPTSDISSTGLVFGEDFSEYAWGNDFIRNGNGYRPADMSSFSNHSLEGATLSPEELSFRSSAISTAIASSRLADWLSEQNVYIHPGYLKLGTSSTKGFVLTPAFPVENEKTAFADVTLEFTRYDDEQDNDWAVCVVSEDGYKGGRESNFTWPDPADAGLYRIVSTTKIRSDRDPWETVTVSGLRLERGNKIAFGRIKGGAKTNARVLLNSISVDIKEIISAPINVSVLETTSSTLSIEWTNGTSAADDKTRAYTAALYDNASCSGTPVRSFDFAANSSYWHTAHSPRFVFTGLTPDTQYYIKVTDNLGSRSNVVSVRTRDFTVKTMPSTITDTGLAFAEDFSECCWNSDYVNAAVGIDPNNGDTGLTTQTPLDSSDPYDTPNRPAVWWQLFKQNSLPSSRLANWLYDAEGSNRNGGDVTSIHNSGSTGRPVMVGPGYLQLGTRREVSSGKYDCAKAWIITPAFPLESGKVATVDVKITAATPGSQKSKWVIAATNSGTDYGNGWLSFSWKDRSDGSDCYEKITLGSTFSEITKTIRIESGDRIVVGPSNDFSNPTWKENTSATSTLDPIMFLSDISVSVVSIDDISAVARPELTVWSFNIACQSNDDNSSWSSSHYWSQRKAAIYQFLNTNNPDIIGTQECEYRQRVDILNNTSGYAAYGLGVKYGRESSGNSGGISWLPGYEDYNADSSNAIFYKTGKFDVVEKGTFWLSSNPSSVGSDNGHNCAWIKFRVKENGYQFYFFNTHFTAHYEETDYAARKAEARILYEQIETINTAHLPVIITGDFNATASEIYSEEKGYTAWSNYYFARNQDGKTNKSNYPTSYNGFKTTFTGYTSIYSSGTCSDSCSNLDQIIYRYFYNNLKHGLKPDSFGTDFQPYSGVTYISDHWPITSTLVFDYQ